MITMDFLTAGKATFTLENKVTGKHMTFKVVKGKVSDKYPKPNFFVHVMTGSDNERSFSYMGVLNTDPVGFRLTRRSRFQTPGDIYVRAFNYALARVVAQTPDTEKVAVHHEGRCGRCGRLLTHPDSIESGIGPECGKHVHPGYHSTAVRANHRPPSVARV